FSRSPNIVIPPKPWHKLLDMNRGEKLFFDVFLKEAASESPETKQNNRWERFSTITNKIADEDIDGFLVYRTHHPSTHLINGRIGIYQRNLDEYNESLILDNRYYKRGCLNCHSFCNNRTDKMLIGIRSRKHGNCDLLVENGVVQKIGAKLTYTSWHPSGRVIAYSFNTVRQFFHSARNEVRDSIDMESMLLYYLVDSRILKTSAKFSKKDHLETYPAWSGDGRYLYFCRGPMSWSDPWDTNNIPPENYDKLQYDLLRISYDIEKDQWGDVETVLSAQDTGLSILMPRISPDGRWLLFCMCDYGCFPAFQQSSDLYMIDLSAAQKTGRYNYRRLDINSDQCDSYHSWSSNSRWIVFSSKRRDGVFTRPYLSYVDPTGKAYKPFLLPQKDPTFYDSCLQTYNTPELVIEPVRATKERLGRVVRGSRQITVEMPITMATPEAGRIASQEYLFEERE
ncbi:MAG: PD40 domain-containing protein, partial [Planctomycetota bacterium]